MLIATFGELTGYASVASADDPYASEPQPNYPMQRPQARPMAPGPAYGDGQEDGPSCCRWSLRYDPFDLLTRRVTVVGEVAIANLPLSIEVSPKYIFGSTANELDERGFGVAARVAWYPGGVALRGVWVKAHAEYENFRATLTRDDGATQIAGAYGKADPANCDADSAPGTCSRGVASTILGLMVGSTQVFGPSGGFAISGGIGIGAALAGSQTLGVLPCTASDVSGKNPNCTTAEPNGSPGLSYTYYDNSSRIRLLGTLGIGVVF